MEKIEHRRSNTARRGRRTRPAELKWKDVATPLLPVLACFLGGATEKWAEGIVVALFGLLLLANPPRTSLGSAIDGIFLALIACAALGFAPAGWFFTPPWREALVSDFAIQLPRTVSPQPWITAGCLASFIAGLTWVYYVTAQELESGNVRHQLRIFAGGVIVLAAVSIALYFAKSALPFWHNQRGFGPFPNRNQTADLLGITSVVIIACGHDDLRHGRKWWIFWLAGLVVAIAAIFLNFSRAGIAILVLGSALWVAVLVLRRGSAARVALGASALLALLTIVLLFGGKTLERFQFHGGTEGGGVSADFRWLIFRDALELIRTSPWCGIGLGNFQPVFAVFREASVGQNRALHPESDWLWAAAELGWPAVILIVVGAALLARRVLPLADGTNLRLRLGAFVGAVLFALHGLVDVSGHRVGSAYAGLLLFGLALRRPLGAQPGRWRAVVFRACGVLFVLIGGAWLVASLRAMPLPGSVGVDTSKRFAVEANKRRDFNETIAQTSRGLEWAPLEWQLYFLRAIGQVGANRPVAGALDDFRRARFLEPGSFEVPYQEGLTWITRDPVLTITAWREALRRAGRDRPALYMRMLGAAEQLNPNVQRMLRDFGSAQPDLAVKRLETLSGAEFTAALDRLVEHDPQLRTLTASQKAQVFKLWPDRGDVRRMMDFVAQRPELLEFAWRAVAKQRATEQDFRGGFELAQRFGDAPSVPQIASGDSIEQLQQKLYASATNYETGLALYQKQREAGRLDEALITLRRFTDQSGAPAYFHFLEAQSWAAKENWERAWKAWEAFDRAGQKP